KPTDKLVLPPSHKNFDRWAGLAGGPAVAGPQEFYRGPPDPQLLLNHREGLACKYYHGVARRTDLGNGG
ncbi:hypothetical protein M9458_033702, partial [Cirrhinus mrigala]